MAAYLDTLTKTTAFGTAAPSISPARPCFTGGPLGQVADAALMSHLPNAGEKHALVARYMR
jgi:hypothetical protein